MLKTVGYLLTKDTDHWYQKDHTRGHSPDKDEGLVSSIGPHAEPWRGQFQPLLAAEYSILATRRDWESSCLLTTIRWGDTSAHCWDNSIAIPLHQLRVYLGHSQSDSGQTRGGQKYWCKRILEQDDQGAIFTGETANLITWSPILLPTV